MLHSRGISRDEIDPEEEAPVAADIELSLVDRSAPGWAVTLGGMFALLVAGCLMALAIVTVLLQTIVAGDGETAMVPALIAVGVTLILGTLVLEYAHTRALVGFRKLREETSVRVRAFLAVPAFFVLSFLHPLAGLAIPAGIGLGALGLFAVTRLGRLETPWAFLPEEAMSLFAGRDARGVQMASDTSRKPALSGAVRQAGTWFSVLISVALGSYLVAMDVLASPALLALALWTYWITDGALQFLASRIATDHSAEPALAQVHPGGEVLDPEEIRSGLHLRGLTVRSSGGQLLLGDVSMYLEPGEVVGLIGESGCGKSLLMQCLADPFALSGMHVSGQAYWDGIDLWARSAQHQQVPLVFVPDQPILLPASGADNLACFQDGHLLERGKWMLEQMVFAHDIVDSMCSAPDARHLPSMQRKALALTRAFLLAPQAYLLDRPEEGLGDGQISALSQRMDHETRLGRSVVMATQNRALLEKCDRLFVMQEGRIVDYGPAEQVRERMASGWARFIGLRRLNTEDNLEKWIRSHFRRDGDEANRRKVCVVASEMLALSCANADVAGQQTVQFLFKHYEGHCMLHMLDGDPPISSGQMKLAAEQAAETNAAARKSVLATIMYHSLDVETDGHLDGRILKAKIGTYDPRKGKQPEQEHAATQG